MDDAKQGVPGPATALHRLVLREFDTVARAALGDDPEASAFRVTGADFVPALSGLMPRYVGVPAGGRPRSDGYWAPDRPMVLELLARTWARRSRRWDPVNRRIAMPGREWVASLRARWPGMFDCEVSCRTGWADLIEATTEWLEARGELVPFDQVRQKYGELRLHGGARRATMGVDLVLIAEVVSQLICELCGAPGRTYGDIYLETLCDEHRDHIEP